MSSDKIVYIIIIYVLHFDTLFYVISGHIKSRMIDSSEDCVAVCVRNYLQSQNARENVNKPDIFFKKTS